MSKANKIISLVESTKTKFLVKLNESEMSFLDFKKQVQEAYAKYFPDSYIKVDGRPSFGSNMIYIRLFLGKDESDFPNGIADNDMFSVRFAIHLNTNEKEENLILPENMELEVNGNFIFVKPVDDYSYSSSFKLPFRKTKGNADKIIKTLDKYFKILKDSLIKLSEEDKILDAHKEVLKKKLK